MKHPKTIILIISAFIFALGSYGQKAPAWLKGYHLDLKKSELKVVQATGATEQEARTEALRSIIAGQSHATGLRANVSLDGDGAISVSGNDNLKVKARVLDEYTETLGDGRCRIHLLTQVARNPAYDFEDVEVTGRYAFSPACFIPGMAQIRKGSTGKGVFLIAAEAICAGGIILSESQRSSYQSKIKTTHNANDKKAFKDKSDNWAMGRNIAIAGAAAFYVWNVIDGVMAKGRKHVVAGKSQLAFAPYYDTRSSGLALRISF